MRFVFFIWSLIERFGGNVVSLLGNVLLSYLLSPDDFGMVTMLGVFSSLIFVLIDCGMSDGLLRMKEPSRKDFNTIFYFNLGVGVLLFLAYALIAPWVAQFLGYPQLRAILTTLGVGAIFSGLTITQITKLRSQLHFRRLAGLNISAISLALCVAVLIALNGGGYWALVELQVGFPGFYFVLLVIFSKWNLRWEFDFGRFKELWAFGVNLLASTIFVQLSQNIFTFILGKYYNPVSAGFMGQAQKLQQTPTNSLEMSISSTSFVLISKCETQEQKNVEILRMFGVMTFVNSLFCMLLLALSYPVIDVVFPSRWLPVVPYFRMMLCWGLVYPVCSYMLIIFKIFGRTDIIRNVMIAEKSLIVVFAFLFYRYGVMVMLASAIVVSLCSLSAYIYFASRLMGVKMMPFVGIFIRNLLPAVFAGGVSWLLVSLTPWSLLAIVAGALVFLVLLVSECKIFFPDYYGFVTEKIRVAFRHAECDKEG